MDILMATTTTTATSYGIQKVSAPSSPVVEEDPGHKQDSSWREVNDRISSARPRSDQSLMILRLSLGIIFITGLLFPSIYEPLLNWIYGHLSQSSIYRLSFAETLQSLVCYITFEVIYTYKFARSPERRIDRRGPIHVREDRSSPVIPFKMKRPSVRGLELLTYVAPVLMMDLTMIKKYAGVGIDDIRESGGYAAGPPDGGADIKATFLAPTLHHFTWESPFQTYRALPLAAPSSRRFITELCLALLIYDSLFFMIHLLFHRVPVLAAFHQPHHR